MEYPSRGQVRGGNYTGTSLAAQGSGNPGTERVHICWVAGFIQNTHSSG